MIETTVLLISLSINVLFLFYSRWLIKIIQAKESDMEDISSMLVGYVSHVKGIHEMEMFYGDETLRTLIEHGSELIEQIESYDFLLQEEDLQPESSEDP